jgi:hypothetical protein
MSWNPAYATPAELAGWINADAVLDAVPLTLSIEAASRAIDQATGRQFGQSAAPEIRYFPAEYDRKRGLWHADVDDVSTTVGLVVEIDDAAVESYFLAPVNAASKGRPYTAIEFLPHQSFQRLAVTARWGWAAVPDSIKLGCLIQAGRLFERRDSPGGPLIGRKVDDVDYRWGNASIELDADVLTSIAPYRRVWAAA